MQKITTAVELKEAILLLEIMHVREELLLKEQFHQMSESLKPLNLIKSVFKDVMSSQGFKTNMVDSANGMTTDYLSKKTLTRVSGNLLVKLFGILLQVGVSNMVTKHPGAIKSTGMHILKRIFDKRRNGAIESP